MTDPESLPDTADGSQTTDASAASSEPTVAAEAPIAVSKNSESPKPRKPKVVLCPYCGHAQPQTDKCSDCGGLFEPLSRRATQIAMGPWAIRNKNHPFRPGCSYEVLVQMIESGRVGPLTVLRGPTTRQFWSVARNVPGVAHLLGYCHACGTHVSKDDSRCPSCDAVFRPVKQRNELGLQFPNRRAAEAAQRSLNRLLGLTPTDAEADVSEGDSPEAESLSEDQAQVIAAAAAAPADQAPESIFEQDAKNPEPADDKEHDLISDLLGDVAADPRSTPAPASSSDHSEFDRAIADAPSTRAEVPAPLRAGDLGTPNPAALPPRQTINWLVVVLALLNVAVAAAAIVYFATRGPEG